MQRKYKRAQQQLLDRSLLLFIVGQLSFLLGQTSSQPLPLVPPLPNGERLRDLAERIERRDGEPFRIGVATYDSFDSNTNFTTVLAREYSILTPENSMKMGRLVPFERGEYDFEIADRHVDFAIEHGMLTHGHVLVWHTMQPDWIFAEGGTDPDAWTSILTEHITTVMSRYQGRIAVWDVVNEAIRDDWTIPFWSRSPWRDTMWHRGIGDDYVDIAFRAAHAADPSVTLLLNDYSVMEQNNKSDQMYAIAKGMLERGVPLHAVGFQGHLRFVGINGCSFAENMERFADLGLDIYITELDVRLPNFIPESIAFQQQARVYEIVMRRCLAQPACVSLQTWGMTDRYSWVPRAFPGYGDALPMDENLQAKPAYYALQSALLWDSSMDDECGYVLFSWSHVLPFLRCIVEFFLPLHVVSYLFR